MKHAIDVFWFAKTIELVHLDVGKHHPIRFHQGSNLSAIGLINF